MSYTRHTYVDFAKILRGQIDDISESFLTEGEVEIAVETVQIIAEQVADLFTKDNPHGFDRARFMAASGVPEK